MAAPVDLLARLASALAIGLLVGVERGWHSREVAEGGRTAGIRTFALIGLLGGVSALLGQVLGGWAMAAVGLPLAAGFILFKYREQQADKDHSVTAVVAALLVYALGAYAAVGGGAAAAAAGVAVVCLLASKRLLHGWLERVKWEELRAALILLAMTFVVLPVLPDREFGPSGAFNPRELWLLTIVLAGVSFVAYVAVRLFGGKRGVLLASVIGSLVSSTAVTVHLAKAQKAKTTQKVGEELFRPCLGGALIANSVMAVRTCILALAIAPALAPFVAPALAGFALVSLVAGLTLAMTASGDKAGPVAEPLLRSPFEPVSVLKLAAILGGVLGLSKICSAVFGSQAILPIAALGGLADVDAVTVANAEMATKGAAIGLAALAVMTATAANCLSKTVLSFVLGGPRFGLAYGLGALAALGAGGAALILTRGLTLG